MLRNCFILIPAYKMYLSSPPPAGGVYKKQNWSALGVNDSGLGCIMGQEVKFVNGSGLSFIMLQEGKFAMNLRGYITTTRSQEYFCVLIDGFEFHTHDLAHWHFLIDSSQSNFSTCARALLDVSGMFIRICITSSHKSNHAPASLWAVKHFVALAIAFIQCLIIEHKFHIWTLAFSTSMTSICLEYNFKHGHKLTSNIKINSWSV